MNKEKIKYSGYSSDEDDDDEELGDFDQFQQQQNNQDDFMNGALEDDDIEDLYIEYRIYIDPKQSTQGIDIQRQCNTFIEYLQSKFNLNDYLWQRDPFYLNINKGDETKQSFIYGKSRFGDSIDDEWFIVYMLIDLSNQFNYISCTVRDNDGEFILIETAKTLPKWMKPSSTINRVFIRSGSLNIIPQPSTPSQLDTIPFKMTVPLALDILSNPLKYDFNSTKSSNQTIDCLNKRLNRFKTNKHFERDQKQICKVEVPLEVAYLLKQYPQLLSRMVEIFCGRDEKDMIVASKMTRFPSPSSASSNISTKIRFTRCLYAQMIQQKFNQPRSFPPLPKPTSLDYSSRLMGVKLHCSLEMLYQRNNNNNNSSSFESYNFNNDSKWKQHLKSLNRNQYFGQEREGSTLYKEKLNLAKLNYFNKQQNNNNNNNQGDNNRDDKINNIIDLIDKCLTSVDKHEMIKFIESQDQVIGHVTNDKWLDKVPSRLEDLLNEFNNQSFNNNNKSTNKSTNNKNKKDKDKDNQSMDNISKSFMNMMNQFSSMDGVDFNGGGSSGKGGSNNPKKEDLNFNLNKFMSTLKNVVGINPKDMGMEEFSDDDDDDEIYDDLNDYQDDDEDDDNQESNQEDEDDDEQEDNIIDDYDKVLLSHLQSKSTIHSTTNTKQSSQSIQSIMKQMDTELSTSSIGQSFEKVVYQNELNNNNNNIKPIDQSTMDQQNDKPIDLNFNLVKNILSSLQSQQGLAGPASNILKELIDKNQSKK